MHECQKPIQEFSSPTSMVILRFLEYGAWGMIGMCPITFKEANGIRILA